FEMLRQAVDDADQFDVFAFQCERQFCRQARMCMQRRPADADCGTGCDRQRQHEKGQVKSLPAETGNADIAKSLSRQRTPQHLQSSKSASKYPPCRHCADSVNCMQISHPAQFAKRPSWPLEST